MSQRDILDLADPWNRLQFVYENCKIEQSFGAYAKEKDGKLAMCGVGWAAHCAGWADSQLKLDMTRLIQSFTKNKVVEQALEDYGFPRKELQRTHLCPLPDCGRTGTLQNILEHLNDTHKISIHNIGKLIPILKKQEKISFNLYRCFATLKRDLNYIVFSGKNQKPI